MGKIQKQAGIAYTAVRLWNTDEVATSYAQGACNSGGLEVARPRPKVLFGTHTGSIVVSELKINLASCISLFINSTARKLLDIRL